MKKLKQLLKIMLTAALVIGAVQYAGNHEVYATEGDGSKAAISWVVNSPSTAGGNGSIVVTIDTKTAIFQGMTFTVAWEDSNMAFSSFSNMSDGMIFPGATSTNRVSGGSVVFLNNSTYSFTINFTNVCSTPTSDGTVYLSFDDAYGSNLVSINTNLDPNGIDPTTISGLESDIHPTGGLNAERPGWFASAPFVFTNPNPAPTLSITNTPSAASVEKGNNVTFTGTPSVTAGTTVTYAFTDGTLTTAAGSTINATTGVLSVHADETATSLTVRATAANSGTLPASIYADASVTVTAPEALTITNTPSAASVQKGNNVTFTGTPSVTTGTTVTYAFADGSLTTTDGSTINATTGVLSVHADETATSLTVRATAANSATTPTSIYADASVTVTDVLETLTITNTPSAASVLKGGTVTFTGTPSVTTGTTVTYAFADGTLTTADGSTINATTGVLTVSATESEATLTVRATAANSTTDPTSAYADASVTVTVPGALTVSISAGATYVNKGASLTFVGTPNPADSTVTYAFADGTLVTADGSTINATTGVLTVSATESEATLTVRATAANATTSNPTAYADKTVSITTPSVFFLAPDTNEEAALTALVLEPSIGSIIRDDASFPADPTRDGYAFIGWYDLDTEEFLNNTRVMTSDDVFLLAVFIEADDEATDGNIKLFGSGWTMTVSEARTMLALAEGPFIIDVFDHAKSIAFNTDTGEEYLDAADYSTDAKTVILAAVGSYEITLTYNNSISIKVMVNVVADPIGPTPTPSATPSGSNDNSGSNWTIPNTGDKLFSLR